MQNQNQIEENFTNFYERWMTKFEDLLQLLCVISREHREHSQEPANYQAVINKLTAHHKEYYTYKWSMAGEYMLPFFSPVWLSFLEKRFLWFTGWKPSMAFRLVESLMKGRLSAGSSLTSMTEEQVNKMDALRVKIKMEEERVENEMERLQMGLPDRNMVELVRLEMTAKTGGATSVSQVDVLVEAAVKELLGRLEKVMKMADCVRLKTLKGILNVLTPLQCVDFLAAEAMQQIQMRERGRKRDQRFNNGD